MDHFLDIKVYLTAKLNDQEVKHIMLHTKPGNDAITGLRSHTSYGRPNFGNIFANLKEKHAGSEVGVFFCGPKALSKKLALLCGKHTDTNTRFIFGKGTARPFIETNYNNSY